LRLGGSRLVGPRLRSLHGSSLRLTFTAFAAVFTLLSDCRRRRHERQRGDRDQRSEKC